MAEQQPPIRTGLLDFFRKSQGCQFVIPVYQRNYTWTAGKEVAQYLEDLTSVLKGEYSNHFLGILIYLDTPIDSFTREYSVIDGQQRLTTTFIILYAIKAILKEKGDEVSINNLDGQYLTNPYAEDKMKYKLKPLVADDEVYQKIVEEKFDEIKEDESNVYKNYLYVISKLKALLGDGYSANDILMALNKLYVVCVPISEEDNAQKIFESINATGDNNEEIINNFHAVKRYYENVQKIEFLSREKFKRYEQYSDEALINSESIRSFLEDKFMQKNTPNGFEFSVKIGDDSIFAKDWDSNKKIPIVLSDDIPTELKLNGKTFIIPYVHDFFKSCTITVDKSTKPYIGHVKSDPWSYYQVFSDKPASELFPTFKLLNMN